MDKKCDMAYMEDGKCFNVLCAKQSACSAVPLRDSDVNPKFAYMDHFLEKVGADVAGTAWEGSLELWLN